jgi:hypothetical protein
MLSADVLVYTTVPEHDRQPRPLCYRHVNVRQADGTIVVKDGVRVEGKGWECEDCLLEQADAP